MSTETFTFTICPTCLEPIEPTEPGVVYAVELRRIDTCGPTTEYVEGMGGYFHEGHFPAGSGMWRQKPNPSTGP